MTSETYLNATQAAQRTGKSLPTIRKYLANGKFPNATQTPKGSVLVWSIPESDLYLAGLMSKVSKSTPETVEKEFRESALFAQIGQLESELRHSRELLARADLELQGYRDRERDQRLALETREAQERRRFSWFRRNPQTATQPRTDPTGTSPGAL